MTDINSFTIYLSFTGATAAAVKGEVEEYIREELTGSIAGGSELSANVTVSEKAHSSSLYVNIKGSTDLEERIAMLAWMAESNLWKTCVLDARAMHTNEHFSLIAESYTNNSTKLLCSYMKDDLLGWAIKESLKYDGVEAKQASADMAWRMLRKAGKLESMVIPLRRTNAS